eukprot:1933455-Pleurochrysis_carterae.AAC.1
MSQRSPDRFYGTGSCRMATASSNDSDDTSQGYRQDDRLRTTRKQQGKNEGESGGVEANVQATASGSSTQHMMPALV